MFDDIAQPRSRWRVLWPEVDDHGGAREAMRLAQWFATLVAGLSLVAAAAAAATGNHVLPAAFAGVLYGAVAFGLSRHLRAAAVVGAVYVSLRVVGTIAVGRIPGVLDLFLAAAMFSGVRGAFAYARLGEPRAPAPPEDGTADAPPNAGAAFTGDDDFAWMCPPATTTDAAAWDRYWDDQLSHGVAGFVHLFVDDGELVDAMRANGLQTVLCVGNGLSMEPRALAWAGFDVTALDLSPRATAVARDADPPDSFLSNLIGGRLPASGGRVQFVTGDVCDPACCPGPYDVIIERRTLQLWPGDTRPAAIQAVADRLAPRGIFFSQSHDGGWKPSKPRTHALEPWFTSQGWPVWNGEAPLTGRVAWLFTTTG